MMPPYYHPTYHSDVSSVEDSSSDHEDVSNVQQFLGVEDNPSFRRSQRDSEYYHDVENYDPSSRQISNYNKSSSRPTKRPNIGDTASFGTQEHDVATVLQTSQVANVNGNSNVHAVKGGLKLIGELYDTKNEVYMNAMLCEAAREGFLKTLCFPNRSKWLQTKVPIWFGSDGILGRYSVSTFFI